jgi:hypothetical protein
MIIGRGRHREHPQPTLFTTTTGVAQLPVAHTQGNPKGVNRPSVTSASHGTTTKKKAREKPGHAQNLFPVRATSDRASSSHVTDVTSGQKALLRMRRTYLRTGHLTDVTSGHVTDVIPVT